MDDQLRKQAVIQETLDYLGRIKPKNIVNAWRKISGSPLGSAALKGAAIGIPAYFLTPQIAKGITHLKGKLLGHTPQQMAEEQAIAAKAAPENRGRVALTLGLLASSLSLAGDYVPRSIAPRTGGLNSFLTWDHVPWSADQDKTMYPKRRKAYKKIEDLNAQKDQIKDDFLFKTGNFGLNMGPGYKNSLYDHPGIPVKYSLDLIYQDKYLNGRDKNTIMQPIKQAGEGPTGLISTKDLVGGAIRAGFGLSAGYLLGSTLGTVLAAPPAVKQTLSATGAFAGLLKNTGVI